MRPAPVGVQCPDCVAAAQAQVAPQLARARRVRAARSVTESPATFALIALNVAVWLAVLVTGGAASRLLDVLMLRPTAYCVIGSDAYTDATAAQCAAAGGEWFPGVAEGAWWQLLTSAFTHESVMHIGFNMVALWVLAPQLERILGVGRFLALYLVSALAGSVSVYWLTDPWTPTLGASGAIFGLMGALLVVAWRNRRDVSNIVMWLGINVAFTFLGGAGISWQGHLGGLAGGVVIASVLVSTPARRSWTAGALILALVVALAALTVARTLSLA